MKILLIAGFSNAEIRERLSFNKSNKPLQTLLRIFGIPQRFADFKDHAPWVTNIINNLESKDNIELHVAGPHIRLAKPIEEFKIRGVTYHFFRSELTSFLRLIGNYKIWRRLQRSTYYTKKILDKVKPDLIIQSGTENLTTCVSILSSDKYPRLCLCQTVFNDSNIPKDTRQNKMKADLEAEIFQKIDHIGVYCTKHYQLLQGLNYRGHIYWYRYPPAQNVENNTNIEKKYDFVNFALNHGSLKGTQDSIQAISLLKKDFPQITLNIVGGVSPSLRNELDAMINELRLTDNVIFTPLFEQQTDLFRHVQQSRFAVLPCKNDYTSGTMTQSMMLGIPLVVYKTAGTPNYNTDNECVLIAENGDVNGLAEHMRTFITNPEKAEILRTNACSYIEESNNNNNKEWEKMVCNFQEIIEDFNNGIRER